MQRYESAMSWRAHDGEVYSDPIAIRATSSIDVTWEIDWTRTLQEQDMVFTVFAESSDSIVITNDSPYKYDEQISNMAETGCFPTCTGDTTVPLKGTYGGGTTSSSIALATISAASMVLAAALII